MTKKRIVSHNFKILRPPLSPRFDLPNKEDLFRVKSGDHVKLIFQSDNDIAERMWVKVEECYDMAKWGGKLDNQPIGVKNSKVLFPGKKIWFHPFDIIDITSKKNNELEDLEKILDDKINKIISKKDKWFKNPHIIVPSIIGLLGVIATIIAALLV